MIPRNTPMATQLVREIISEICCGESKDDVGLPSEAELSQRFGVSRATVREGLAKLEDGGAVVRRHGVGTFVSPMALDYRRALQSWFAELPNFLHMIQDQGYEPGCRLLGIGVEPAGPVADRLEISPQSQVVSIKRILLANSTPIIHSVYYVPLDLVKPSDRETICSLYKCTESIYELTEQRCNRRTDYHRSEMRTVIADEELSNLLQCSPGDPLLLTEDIGYNSEIEPLWYGVYWYRGDMVSFVQMHRPKLVVG